MGGHFDISKINKEIEELKNKTLEDGFYNDSVKSTEVLTTLSRKQKEVKEYNSLNEEISDDLQLIDLVTDEEIISLSKRIEELEKENAELREELEYYRNRKLRGRQKHNAKWMAIYNDFVVGYESGMTMVEIAKRNHVSERTIYRYKAYYDKMKKKEE